MSRHWKAALAVAAVLALAALLTACSGAQKAGDAAPSGSSEVQSGEVTVEITPGMRYSPDNLTVKVGTTVTWVNHDTDGMAHDVASGVLDGNELRLDGKFHSPMLAQNDKWSYTFDTPGTYPYLCTVPGHAQAGMVATVTVVP